MIDIKDALGVIFDLDGTLVTSSLDFTAIREEIGCPRSQDLLEFIAHTPDPSVKKRHSDIVLAHELEDARDSQWLAGARDFIDELIALGTPLAIVTRNCRRATGLKIKNNQIPIHTVLTREDAPAKPKPDALLKIATLWGCKPQQLLYVGDYIYDEQAAHNAGMRFAYSPFG